MVRQFAVLTLFTVAAPVVAQTVTTPTPAAPVIAKPQPEKQLCRRIEETGSIMGGKRICHTKADWAAIDMANGNAASSGRDVRGHGGGQQGGGGLN